MKNLTSCFMAFILFVFCIPSINYAQKGQNEFEKRRVEGILDQNIAIDLNKLLAKDDPAIINKIKEIFANNSLKEVPRTASSETVSKGSDISIRNLSIDIKSTIENIEKLGNGSSGGENAGVIIVYRSMKIAETEDETTKIDFPSLKTLIYHKKRNSTEISNYLLATKKVYFIFIDLDDDFYTLAEDHSSEDKKLSNTIIQINYKTSFLKQSLQGVKSIWQNTMGGAAQPYRPRMKFTLIEVDPKRIKDPCDIVGVNKTISEDLLTFTVHEKNFASIQVGLENTKYALNNFSISGGNLVVKPNDTQKENWKSSLYSVIELHIPRDIDNFQPLWKDIFSKGRDRNAGQYLYDALIARIGIYGGVKVSKDPLSNLYSGFNFAITKELYINFGWTWINEITPQVTEIGNITSLNDAKEYAKRQYSSGKFSWGLSFAPSAVISMLGIKAKDKN
jgi:hypothetical protein